MSIKENIMQYCCDRLNRYIEDRRIPINYSAKFREYYLPLGCKSSAIQLIDYCPWCGTKLPVSLNDEYISILDEYGIDDYFDEEQLKRLPPEFKTDEWWKKRGL
jgi:hypothetical protein